MSELEAVLREIKEFRRETANSLNDIKEDLRKTNRRSDEAERRIGDTEERVQSVEEVACELIKLQRQLQEKQPDQEGRNRRDNIRLHGIKEGAESMSRVVEGLLREKLELPLSYQLNVELKLLSFKCKEDIIKKAWERKGFLLDVQKVYGDHDYAPEVMKRRKEYTEA